MNIFETCGDWRVLQERTRTLLLALGALFFSTPSLAAGWEQILVDDGIRVSTRQIEGRELPAFKGVGVVNAPMVDVLAVLTDTPRRVEWVHKCSDSRLLEEVTEKNRVIYSRTKAPWPVSDRDVVVRTRSSVNWEKKEIMIRFKEDRSYPFSKLEGVVRIPRIEGFYRLQALGENKTRVTYQIDAEPGGSLPAWLAELTSRKIPYETIMGLRSQVKKTQASGVYRAKIAEWEARRKEKAAELKQEGNPAENASEPTP